MVLEPELFPLVMVVMITVITKNYLLESIVAPWEKIVPTYLNQMPANFGDQLGPKELDALVRFVRQLDEVVDANGELRDEPENATN